MDYWSKSVRASSSGRHESTQSSNPLIPLLMRLFITGTDTGVGKTYVAAGLVAAGRDCVGLKPICCGGREDAEALHAAGRGALSLNEVNPVWLRPPVAPYTAAMIESRLVDVALVRETIASAASRHAQVVVEGAGGWLVPIAREYTFADLAVELGWPVLVVAANRLGVLNHTLLTLEAIARRGLQCVGVVLNEPAPSKEEEQIATATNLQVLETLTEVPVWELAYGAQIRCQGPWQRLVTPGQE
jgi:dethiobiotin synthetase